MSVSLESVLGPIVFNLFLNNLIFLLKKQTFAAMSMIQPHIHVIKILINLWVD